MSDNQQHAELVAQVVQAHKEMTGEPPTSAEHGTIQAVTRDYLKGEK